MINFKVTTTTNSDTEGAFIVEPLEAGFGHTLGNCLRRVLLTSLEGSAISFIKIDGVSHQFSVISGISEDVTEIILNLKQVRLKIFSDKPIKMRLQASGKGEVKARDIDTLGGAEIINPDLHIASLNSPSAKLNIEMTAEKGVGYLGADEKKAEEIGVISIDSIYSPVVLVNYKVEPTRVGRSSNFDKLILNITTDGTIKPEEALNESARILSVYFKQIFEPTFEGEEVVEPAISNDVLKLSVEELDLPVRITNALKAVDIDTVENLITTSRTQLLKAKNLGVQSLSLISQKLSERGLILSEA
ncbi:MAG: DNA-directed RNA polymerase subunit alpha [Candidatus Daviesbacteria bacterium GW2011_GWA1_41_61]|uniref:DNA-directed RNA polymerase subunit alpha n=1 Tax=Candidatus Daviesbacteria bacterium GW2011_GWA2_40_9 TaxID=1618424 RepID=A0A0G0TZ41_9BACT|nr:MAG: DNA-directed RNA polymerase subunit alpha [Candidatus Daviesbacteria bacterium GW2011_GWC1_40_9]KKR82093.1 MAG: DNA-directed RNA polymerase subunit alpha [Candidatus Daviesbacteria bacterium GW2011_GWA2_40_9]KKR93276.1 MAG: DNA-directed RNA polymerase subunit alpha [Candidatus Daviesbacteria bacterium GW2011_GWB1_41_15]KKS14764.1 MAG: DNA-directed RNA polymerase subunit alpha [Candidatus Daviesbacteria bacterium GW2011_GWA1_41_61]